MSGPAFKIRYGQLDDVTGCPRRFEDVTFVPARVTLGGSSFSFSHPLQDYIEDLPAASKRLVKPGDDAPWVLGRLMFLFNTPVPTDEFRPEKCCFHESFVAVIHSQENLSIPFHCTDYYCRSSLIFSEEVDPPPLDLQEEVARHFWSLLLSAPTDVADYDSKMFHPGACIWMRFGVEHGESYLLESES